MKRFLAPLRPKTLSSRFAAWSNKKMDRLGMDTRGKALAVHLFNQLYETALAVVPITLHLVICMAIFFQRQSTQPGLQAAGLISAIIGLTLFVDGLRVCVMPLGELVGRRLPEKFPLPIVLIVAFCLGILCTYAEPAISSLRPLAEQVDRRRAPYLHFVLMEKQEILVLCIGLGVGTAAVLGTYRFVKGWSLKPFIAATLAPTVACACYMHWGNPDLKPLLGLCWDSGAVTTGPVTVPVLLSMGIGVMKSVRQKRLAKAVLKNATSNNTGQALEGFGVVTLASILPILAVELMSIVFGSMYTTADILAMPDKSDEKKPVEETSPLQEVVYAIRAILPLIAALILIVLFILRDKLPKLSVYTMPKEACTSRTPPKDTPPADLSDHSKVESTDVPTTNGSIHHTELRDADGVGDEPDAAPAAAAGQGVTDSGRRAKGVGRPLGEGLENQAGPAMARSESAALMQPVGITLEVAGSPKGLAHPGSSPALLQASGRGALVPDASVMPLARGAAGALAQKEGAVVVAEGGDAMDSAAEECALEIQEDGVRRAEGDGNAHGEDESVSGDSELESEEDGSDTDSEEEKEEKQPGRRGDTGREEGEDGDVKLAVCAGGGEGGGGHDEEAQAGVREAAVAKPRTRAARWRRWRHWGLTSGVCMCLFGMILFNLGLTYGFNALGNQAGTLLPAAYLDVEQEAKSPYYDYIGGIFLVEIIIFLLGILATRAEPALNVLGRTVESLSGGVFTKKMLIWAVSLGVGVGMAVGSTKILFGVPIMYIILIKYFIVCVLTVFSKEDFTNIAWDSAGVTTGPVSLSFIHAGCVQRRL
ncbi:hypothetical protein DUNSADRAFT_11187 [Dunaliella salina]|uniref:Uncharacterized protein n=1 Tax=Dunaliella salina TaxID=3046 RepID=A0ABQ7GDY0_DUNSA|nr:hypothetical protein DUNSADRAFT_11187 [Dunaliella salina]|eukprot:KAF5832814.1 hypothetical protein DUNSADRAFT_11187 [Dunaliella salina]